MSFREIARILTTLGGFNLGWHWLRGKNHENFILESIDLERIIETECYKALKEIIEIVRDDELDDINCFERIEKVVCSLEDIGIHCGNRHDFG